MPKFNKVGRMRIPAKKQSQWENFESGERFPNSRGWGIGHWQSCGKAKGTGWVAVESKWRIEETPLTKGNATRLDPDMLVSTPLVWPFKLWKETGWCGLSGIGISNTHISCSSTSKGQKTTWEEVGGLHPSWKCPTREMQIWSKCKPVKAATHASSIAN